MTNVLLLYEAFIPSVRLCAYEQLNYLKGLGVISFEHCLVKNVTKEMCVKSDVVVIVRGSTELEEKLVGHFRKNGKLLIYVLDDDLLNIVDGLSSSKYYKSKDVIKRIRRIMQYCHILVTPSPRIKDKYGEYFSKAVLIEEPALTYQNKARASSNIIRIGFAGSIDRTGDHEDLISEVIRKLVSKYKERISVEFMGARPRIVDELSLTYYPYNEDYISYKMKLEALGWDIGIAPMPDTEFHRCKHYNKYIEYTSASIVGVYSNVEPYTRIIRSKHNGLLCDDSIESWVDAISSLIDHEDLLETLRINAKAEIEEKFTVAFIAKKLLEDLPELSTYKEQINSSFPLFQIKCYSLLIKIIHFIKRHGYKSPYIAIQKIKDLIHMISSNERQKN